MQQWVSPCATHAEAAFSNVWSNCCAERPPFIKRETTEILRIREQEVEPLLHLQLADHLLTQSEEMRWMLSWPISGSWSRQPETSRTLSQMYTGGFSLNYCGQHFSLYNLQYSRAGYSSLLKMWILLFQQSDCAAECSRAWHGNCPANWWRRG